MLLICVHNYPLAWLGHLSWKWCTQLWGKVGLFRHCHLHICLQFHKFRIQTILPSLCRISPWPKKWEKNPSRSSKKLSKLQTFPKLLKHKHCTCTYPTAANHRSQPEQQNNTTHGIFRKHMGNEAAIQNVSIGRGCQGWPSSSWWVPDSATCPFCMTNILCTFRIVDRRWATKIVVRPTIDWSRASCTICSDPESRALVASSKRRIDGFFSMARAIATRCFWPPDNNTPLSPTCVHTNCYRIVKDRGFLNFLFLGNWAVSRLEGTLLDWITPTLVLYASGSLLMKSCTFAALQTSWISSMVAPSLPYNIFSSMLVANNTGSWFTNPIWPRNHCSWRFSRLWPSKSTSPGENAK